MKKLLVLLLALMMVVGTVGCGTETDNKKPSTGSTTQLSTPVHEYNWKEVTEDEIHYYAWRTLCGKCGTDMTDDEAVYHSANVNAEQRRINKGAP